MALTKNDITILKGMFDQQTQDIKRDIRDEMDAKFSAFRNEMNKEFAAVREEFTNVRQEMKDGFRAVRLDFAEFISDHLLPAAIEPRIEKMERCVGIT